MLPLRPPAKLKKKITKYVQYILGVFDISRFVTFNMPTVNRIIGLQGHLSATPMQKVEGSLNQALSVFLYLYIQYIYHKVYLCI